MVPEYNPEIKEASGGFINDNVSTISKLDLQSCEDNEMKTDEFVFLGIDSAKISKPPEEESILIEDINPDLSTQSIDSFINSARKLRKDTEQEYGPKGATKGKAINKTDWVKGKNSSTLVNSIKRFFQKSSYHCGCKDDLDFK